MTPIPLANHLTKSEIQQRIDKEKDSSVKDKYRALL
jgi:5,10-methylene-tetrahydrofolate dehydrogenase/methenyl tetrahydrofolate cyclohydrolase